MFHKHQAYLYQQGVLVHLLCEKDNHSYILESMRALLCVRNKVGTNMVQYNSYESLL